MSGHSPARSSTLALEQGFRSLATAVIEPDDAELRKRAISIVVPCFNEEPVLLSLRERLSAMNEAFSAKYDVRLVLVDDGSTDNTWPLMSDLFGTEPNCKLV